MTAAVTTADAPVAAAAATTAAKARVVSVDVLRGVVMVLMALDHVRDFFTELRILPEDMSQSFPGLFFTRWVTHFCAPAFVFLAGTGAYLSLGRGRDVRSLSRFLWTRGLFLMVLELTVVRLAWTFNPSPRLGFWVQVIWAIGVSMVILAGLVRLPLKAVAAFGLVMIAGHNLLDGINPPPTSPAGWLWSFLHVQNLLLKDGQPIFMVAYPIIPWVGVMAAGYAFGALYRRPEAERRRTMLLLGGAITVGFVLLRLTNTYGNPEPWAVQADPLMTVASFLNNWKYPPSLLYLMMTLGPSIMALALLERARGPVAGFFEVFGRVPMFYYLAHIVLAHLLAGLTALAMGFGTTVLTSPPFFGMPDGWGFGLPAIYVIWVVVVLLLYPPCKWYADLKARRRDLTVLSYF